MKDFSPLHISDENDKWNKLALQISQEQRDQERKTTHMNFMERLLGQNWLTTLGGIIAAIGGLITMLPKTVAIDPQWSVFVVGIGAAIAGFGGKSFNVHSTTAETKIATEEKAEKVAEKIVEAKKG